MAASLHEAVAGFQPGGCCQWQGHQSAIGQFPVNGAIRRQTDGIALRDDGNQQGDTVAFDAAPPALARELFDAPLHMIGQARHGQRVFAQVGPVQGGHCAQGVPLATEYMAAAPRQVVDLQGRFVRQLTGIRHKKLQLPTQQPVAQLVPVAGEQAQVDAGVAIHKAGTQGVHQSHRRVGPGTDGQAALFQSLQARHLLMQGIQRAQHRPGMGQGGIGKSRGPGTVTATVEQGDAQLLLELLDGAAERRLGEVGGLRRTGKVAVVHQGDEVLQQSGIHASIMQDAHQKAINNALDD